MRISDWSSDVCSSDLTHRYGTEVAIPLGEDDARVGTRGDQRVVRQHRHRRVGSRVKLHGGEHARAQGTVGIGEHATGTLGARPRIHRSDDGRVGKDCVRTCSYWVSPYLLKKKK